MPEPITAPAPTPVTAPTPTPAPTPAPVAPAPSNPSIPPVDPSAAPTPETFDWRKQIPEEFKNDTTLAQIKDLPDLIKGYANSQRVIGKKRVVLPGADNKPEEVAEFRKAIGVPETPDAYGVTKVKLPDGINIATESLSAFEKTAHEAGLTPKQVESVMGFYLKDVEGQVKNYNTAMETQKATDIANLQKKWGKDFDTKIATAKIAAKHFGGDAMLEKMDVSRNGGSDLIELFEKIGSNMLEDSSLVSGKVTPTGFTGSKDQALYTIEQIKAGSGEYKTFWKEMNDMKNPDLRDRRVAQWNQLMKQAS